MNVSRADSRAQESATSIAKFFRAVLKAIGLCRAVVPTIEPAKSRGGRRPTYDGQRGTPAQRKRRQRWNDGKATSRNQFRDSHETCHETSPLKEEEKKERSGAPISKDWRPDPDTERETKEWLGDYYESDLADHIDYCLKENLRSHNHNATWRRRARALKNNPQMRLDLRPRGRQLGVKSRRRARQQEPPAGRAARLREETIRTRESAAAPASPESKAAVQAKLNWFLGR